MIISSSSSKVIFVLVFVADLIVMHVASYSSAPMTRAVSSLDDIENKSTTIMIVVAVW
jgi:hypothetical protein